MLNLHPPVSAFPFALLVVAGLLELVRIFLRRDWVEHGITVCVAGAVCSAIAAFLTGYSAAERADGTFSIPDEVIAQHHNAGRLLLFAVIPCALLRGATIFATHGRIGFSLAYRALLTVCIGLVVYTGYLGGKLVFEHGAGVTAPIPTQNRAPPPPKP